MAYLLLVFLPIAMALYAYMLRSYRWIVFSALGVTLALETYLLFSLPLDRPVRLLGVILSLTATGRLFACAFILLAGVVLTAAHVLAQGELPIPVGLFVLGIGQATVLLDDWIVIALLLEVIGLAIVLATVDRPQEPVGLVPVSALMADLRYLVMMVLAGSALVLGLLMADLARESVQPGGYIRLALGLLVVGLGLGTAVVPFHPWFPDLAAHTSTAVSGLLVSLVQGAGLLLLGRVFLDTPELLAENATGRLWLLGGAVVAGGGAALLAIGQDRWKRLAAFAASYDAAVILFAFGLGSGAGLQSGFFLTIHHMLALVLLLLCIGTLEWSSRRDDVAGLVGASYRMPVVALGLIVAVLSLAGIPPLGGFAGRWSLYVQALAQGWAYLAGLLVAAAFFLLAMVRALWPTLLPVEQTGDYRRPPWAVSALIVLLIVCLLVLGLYPTLVLEVVGLEVGS